MLCSHIRRSTFCPKTNGRSRATSSTLNTKVQGWNETATCVAHNAPIPVPPPQGPSCEGLQHHPRKLLAEMVWHLPDGNELL